MSMEEGQENTEVVQEQQVAAPEPEQQEQVEVKSDEQVAAEAEDAAIQAGFNAAQGIEEPEPEPAPPEPEPQLIAGYTPEQVKEAMETIAALKQREAKIFGSMGSMKQTIDSLRNQQTTAQPVKITAEKLTRLSKEFPEIAQMLAEDLSESLQIPQGQSQPSLNEEVLKTQLEQTSRAFETKLLTVQHRDWKQVVQSPEFIGWKEALPEETKTQLDNSWDAEFIGGKLDEFKAWKASKAQAQVTNKQRLAAAVTPKSSGSVRSAPTEADAFAAGFRAVRG